jgi:hypothetical protein
VRARDRGEVETVRAWVVGKFAPQRAAEVRKRESRAGQVGQLDELLPYAFDSDGLRGFANSGSWTKAQPVRQLLDGKGDSPAQPCPLIASEVATRDRARQSHIYREHAIRGEAPRDEVRLDVLGAAQR